MTQRYAAQEWKSCFKDQRKANNDWRRLNAAHGTRLVNGPPSESSSSFADSAVNPSERSSELQVRAMRLQCVIAARRKQRRCWGGVAQNAAQDTVMSGGAAGRRRTSPVRKKTTRSERDDSARRRRQKLDMEVSNVAKINDCRRILDLRRDGWELENITHREAAIFCAFELSTWSHPHALHQADSTGINMGIHAEDKGRKG